MVHSWENGQRKPLLQHLKEEYGTVKKNLMAVIPHKYLQGGSDVLAFITYGTHCIALHANAITNFDRICYLLGQRNKRETIREIRKSRLLLDHKAECLIVLSYSKPHFIYELSSSSSFPSYLPLGILDVLPEDIVTEAQTHAYRIHVGTYTKALSRSPQAFCPYGENISSKHFHALTNIPVELYAVRMNSCVLMKTVSVDIRDLRNTALFFRQNSLILGMKKACKNMLELFDAMLVYQAEYFYDSKAQLLRLPCVPSIRHHETSRVKVKKIPVSFPPSDKKIATVEEALNWTTKAEADALICDHFPDNVEGKQKELFKRFQTARAEYHATDFAPGTCYVKDGVAHCFLPYIPRF